MEGVLVDPTSRDMAIFELQTIKLPHYAFVDEQFGYLNESEATRPTTLACTSGQ